MNQYHLTAIALLAFIVLMINLGCSTAEDVTYTLTVSLGAGATGTPLNGSYQNSQNEQVPYGYTLEQGYQNLEVTLDGAAVAAAGVITMTSNHTLIVTAEEIFDIRGQWHLTLNWSGYPSESWYITFSGGLSSGSYMDGNGHTGTYTVDGSNVNIDYTSSYSMRLVGAFSSQTEMSGDITEAVGSGTWTASKQ
jgi:hypothetical protein